MHRLRNRVTKDNAPQIKEDYVNNGNSLPQNGNFKDMGFGTQITAPSARMLNQDGSFNVIRTGIKGQHILNMYNTLITMPWAKFTLIIIAYFTFANTFFAGLYCFAGVENLGAVPGESSYRKFFDAFFFSAQTITTVGYGHMHPEGMLANSIAAIESLTGLLGFALVTGLLYGKFSRPVAKISYSESAIIAPYRDVTAFEFRIANMKSNQLIDVEAVVNFSMVKEINGLKSRIFETLELERTKIQFFPTSWTIVHPITEKSPLYGITEEALIAGNAEFLINLNAFDDTFSQAVHSRNSYKYHEVTWGAKFKPMFISSQNGKTILELDKISDMGKVDIKIS